MIVFGGVAGLVGADGDPEAAFVVPIIGVTGGMIVLFTVVVSLPSVIIGYGLYRMERWSRIAGIVISILNLLWFPLGTALGVYGLWVLFSKDGQALFDTARTA
jgi:hypothetical protein